MAVTAYWSPNQAAIAQVETYTFSAPTSVGNTYVATTNGKSITYSSVSGDTAATVATAVFALLNLSTGIAPELTEVVFTNPSSGVLVAAARVPGTPFANVTVGGVAGQGLVMSTGNGLAGGIATAHTTANASPSDVLDPQNWLRANMAASPPAKTRAVPVNGDDVVVDNSGTSMLWNLDRLSTVQFNTYTRYQSFTGNIGLPERNPAGYTEWRATYFKFLGPQGSVPAGGLAMVLGQGDGSGPGRERYDLQSSQYTMAVVAAGRSVDTFSVCVLGQHTANTITALGGVSVGVARATGEKANLSSSVVGNGAVLGVGPEVAWTAGSTLTVNGGSALLSAAPASVLAANGSQVTVEETDLTWTAITARNSSLVRVLAGGVVTTLVLETNSTLDKSADARALTITNSTIDGDSCRVLDPLSTITWTNATTVKQTVSSGPFTFTGTRTVKVT